MTTGGECSKVFMNLRAGETEDEGLIASSVSRQKLIRDGETLMGVIMLAEPNVTTTK